MTSRHHIVISRPHMARALSSPDFELQPQNGESKNYGVKFKIAKVVADFLDGALRIKDFDKKLKPSEAVEARRELLRIEFQRRNQKSNFLDNIPYKDYDFGDVVGVCCENVVGYVPIPLGVAGPLIINNESFYIPLATTEGALVASVSRGCKAINDSQGVTTVISADAMTRAPCFRCPNVMRALDLKSWLESQSGRQSMDYAFSKSSSICKLHSVSANIVGHYVYARFRASTGDAMGMNMISKCVLQAVEAIHEAGFEDCTLIALSGNVCSDKKSTAINWIEGRGKSVVAQARISAKTLQNVLRTDAKELAALNIAKNYVGSAVAGSLGGFNAHASNVVSAIFLATGQDVAQNVECSQCITTMEESNDVLIISVTMPCIEVGTIGGGTHLKAQASVLDLVGLRGTSVIGIGENSRKLASLVAAAVLAGELSLCSALATQSLVRSHMELNRKKN